MPYLPALILGLVLSVYWARVMRLAWKIHRQAGHSPNFSPSEPIGKWLRIAWHPTVAVWIAQPYLVAFMKKLPWTFRPLIRSEALAWPAAAVVVLALAGTMVCWRKMGKSWRMGINPDEKTELIVSGPYAYVRHPIYALSSLLMLASVAIVPSPLMLIACGIHLLLLQLEARREEKYLAIHHGPGYLEYCRRVGRFVPRWHIRSA